MVGRPGNVQSFNQICTALSFWKQGQGINVRQGIVFEETASVWEAIVWGTYLRHTCPGLDCLLGLIRELKKDRNKIKGTTKPSTYLRLVIRQRLPFTYLRTSLIFPIHVVVQHGVEVYGMHTR